MWYLRFINWFPQDGTFQDKSIKFANKHGELKVSTWARAIQVLIWLHYSLYFYFCTYFVFVITYAYLIAVEFYQVFSWGWFPQSHAGF